MPLCTTLLSLLSCTSAAGGSSLRCCQPIDQLTHLYNITSHRFPQFAPTPLSKIITSASPEAIDLITQLCAWDPAKRPTVQQVRRR